MPSQILSPKRKAISDSSRAMFIWIAAMSAVVGVCAVVAIFLARQIEFKGRVVGEMTKTADTLAKNNKVAKELTSNVGVLETNASLNSIKANSDENALQVVLDALPADRNPLALGASLQQSLLSGIDGLSVESLTVDPEGEKSEDNADTKDRGKINIDIQVSASNANTIKEMLVRFEKSIRVIDIDSVVIERGDDRYLATIKGHAYYQPAKEVSLGQKTVPAQKGGR